MRAAILDFATVSVNRSLPDRGPEQQSELSRAGLDGGYPGSKDEARAVSPKTIRALADVRESHRWKHPTELFQEVSLKGSDSIAQGNVLGSGAPFPPKP